MRRIALLGALLTAGLACALALSTPRPLYAVMCCDNGGYSTSYYYVLKPTCSEAQSMFRALALPEAQDFCGGATRVCATSIPSCYLFWDEFGNLMYVVSGWMIFGCKETCPIVP